VPREGTVDRSGVNCAPVACRLTSDVEMKHISATLIDPSMSEMATLREAPVCPSVFRSGSPLRRRTAANQGAQDTPTCRFSPFNLRQRRLQNKALHKRIIPGMFSKVFAILGITVFLASASDVPPKSLVRENIKKASVIVKGVIETSNAPRPGVTVANFRVNHCYRGSFKPGDVILYASFREGDSYSSGYLHTDLIVFLRKRSPRFTPPDWETATDLSELLYTSDLEAMLPRHDGRKHP
jgi:hypothetical protein